MSRIERILTVLGLVVLALHVVGAFFPASWFWGFHHYGFLPRPFLAALLLPLVLLVPGFSGAFSRAAAPLARVLEDPRRARIAGAVFVAVMALFFFLARTRTFLLSDSQLLIRSVNQGFVSFTADTLAAVAQLWFHLMLRSVFNVSSETTSFRILSIVCGAVWLAAMCFTTARLTRNGWQRLLLMGLLGTAGLTKLFYGYAETGPLLTAAIGVYIWAAIRVVQDGKGIIFATLAFLAASALHVTGLLLFPSFLFVLGGWASAGGARRAVPAAAAVLLPVLAYMVFWFSRGGTAAGVARAYAPYFAEFIPLGGPLDSRQAYTLFSPARVAEFLNEQIFIGPLAILALAGALLLRRKWPRVGLRTFLLLLIVPFLALSVVFNRKLGGARDWDLLASVAVPAILLTAVLLFEESDAAGRRGAATLPRTALFLTSVSLVHLVGIVLVDVDHDWSVRHFAALFDDRAPVSRFARSYALEEVGHYYVDRSRPAEAVGWFEKAAAIDPSNSKAIGTLGSYYASSGRKTEALPLLREAVRLGPRVAVSHFNLGTALSETGQWDEASVSFSEAIRLQPNLHEAYIGLSLARSRAGHYAAAESAARAGLALPPGAWSTALQMTLGTSLERQGRIGEAEQAYREALRLDPENREALFNLGRLLINRESWGEAIPLLERLTRLDPADGETAVNLGVAYLHTGRRESAEGAFQQAIRANPKLLEAYLNLAALYQEGGRNEAAAAVLEAYAVADSQNAAAIGISPMISRLREAAKASSPP
jgi:tetratricopeptide (TPR) repeat protein